MNGSIRCGAAVVVLLLSGCSAVYSPQPVGDEPVSLAPGDWNGTWVTHDGAMRLSVVSGDSGQVRLSWVEESSANPQLGSARGHIRRSGPWTFGSIPDEDDTTRYVWCRLERTAGQLVLWLPDPERFEALVRSGALPGRSLGGGDVMLGRLGAKEVAVLMAKDRPTPFLWDEPKFFLRVGK